MRERAVIYTCIIGAYDELLQPGAVDPEIDYICYVGKGEKTAERIGVWQIRELDADISDPALLSRYPKMNPHLLLEEYDASLWIDGNIEIVDASIYKAFKTKIASGVKYSGVAHPSRDCIYDEAYMCRNMGYISNLKTLYLWAFYFFKGIRRHEGLMENNIIFRRHNDPDIVSLDALWWDMVQNFCRRDQLSLMWCLRKCGIRRDYLIPRGQSSRNYPGLRYLRHK